MPLKGTRAVVTRSGPNPRCGGGSRLSPGDEWGEHSRIIVDATKAGIRAIDQNRGLGRSAACPERSTGGPRYLPPLRRAVAILLAVAETSGAPPMGIAI